MKKLLCILMGLSLIVSVHAMEDSGSAAAADSHDHELEDGGEPVDIFGACKGLEAELRGVIEALQQKEQPAGKKSTDMGLPKDKLQALAGSLTQLRGMVAEDPLFQDTEAQNKLQAFDKAMARLDRLQSSRRAIGAQAVIQVLTEALSLVSYVNTTLDATLKVLPESAVEGRSCGMHILKYSLVVGGVLLSLNAVGNYFGWWYIAAPFGIKDLAFWAVRAFVG